MKSFTFILTFILLSCFTFAKTVVVDPVVEYKVNPVGIDVMRPRLSWKLVSGKRNVMQTAYEIRVASTVPGLSNKNKQLWNSGRVESDRSVNVPYEGPALKSMQRVYWQVRVWDNKGGTSNWSEPAYWETGILEPELWKAEWITLPDEVDIKGSKPAHYYRKEFSLLKKIKSARVYVTSLGLYELFINGRKVSDDLFTPGWTSYTKRLQYQTYDVTSMLVQNNAIGAIVGDGWYRGFLAWAGRNNYYGDKIALLCQLHIIYSDGSSETIITDGTWKVNNGPIRESDIYNGELYDARLEMEGWNSSGFDDNKWRNAVKIQHSKKILVAQEGVPVKAMEELTPVKMIKTPKGETVIDIGQNMTGWVRIKMKGNKGDTVKLRFAEVLDKDGNFYTANLRSAKATDTYIFKDDKDVVYEPHFTFHGFRYVKLEGFSELPAPDDIKGVVIYSDMKKTGTFECSDSLINRLQQNIQWGQKGNFLDVPTDCPQRDERLGWTGDAQVFSMTAAFNFDVAAFYTKWMEDVTADQLENGKITHVVPDVLKGGGGSAGWADVVAIVPWTVYRVYGDKRILEKSFPAIKKWIGFMTDLAGDDYLWTGGSHFGDWLAFATTRSDYPGATTDKDLIATAYYYHTTNLASKIAEIIGEKDDAVKYRELAGNIKEAFNKEFVTPNGRLVSHTQTAYVLALSFGLLPDDIAKKAAYYLADDVKKFRHLTTGFLGTPLLCSTLSVIGREDLAFMLLNRKHYPSWLYPVTKGATTIWERWDGIKPDGSFQDTTMNSFNHYAYGAVGEWLYSYVAGIGVDEKVPGYKHVIFSPHPGGGLTYAKATFESMYGMIVSDWKIEKGEFVYEIEVPVSTTATVILPGADAKNVLRDGEVLSGKRGPELRQNNGNVEIEIGSGRYRFTYPVKEM